MTHVKYAVVLAALLGFLLPLQVSAQQSPFVIENAPKVVGIGVGAAPDYEGSNNYKAVAAPFFKFNFSDSRYVMLWATELTVNLLDHPFFWSRDPVCRQPLYENVFWGESHEYSPNRPAAV